MINTHLVTTSLPDARPVVTVRRDRLRFLTQSTLAQPGDWPGR